MAHQPTYTQLASRVEAMGRTIGEYEHQLQRLQQKFDLLKYSSRRRTICLIRINDELNKELASLKSSPPVVLNDPKPLPMFCSTPAG